MDLRQQFPRSVRDTLGGYVHLPRMIDKGRAVLTHTLGEYIFPCSLDQRLLDFLGLSPERFLQAVEEHGDSRIEGWLRQHTLSHTPQEIMDWNQTQLARGPDSEEKLNYFTQTRNAIDPTRSDITTWAALLDLEENRQVPPQIAPPHSPGVPA